MSQPLHVMCRPASWDEVVGQTHVCKSIQDALRSGAQSFLLTGPSGVGKTTIGRLIASTVKCRKRNILEIDAATNSGVDAMRLITEASQFTPIGGGSKVIIVDECHSLSGQAWQSLLKSVEEPPKHVYWVLCTTERNKVPKTIVTRCHDYDLGLVSQEDLESLIESVCTKANGLDGMTDEFVALAAERADGSPRQALVNISKIRNCENMEDAEDLLDVVSADSKEAIDLCRALISREPWDRIAALINKLEGKHPESVRIVVFAYFTKVVLGKSPKPHHFAVLDAFSEPYPVGVKSMGLIALSAGQLYFGD